MPTEKPRFTVIVDEELLKQIDDFRFENRYPSRSAATLELIRLGIQQIKKEKTEKLQSYIHQSDKLENTLFNILRKLSKMKIIISELKRNIKNSKVNELVIENTTLLSEIKKIKVPN